MLTDGILWHLHGNDNLYELLAVINNHNTIYECQELLAMECVRMTAAHRANKGICYQFQDLDNKKSMHSSISDSTSTHRTNKAT